MRIVFFGSDNFAVPSLKALIKAGCDIACVVTQPDRKQGRGLPVGITAVKEVAQDAGLKIYQPGIINEPDTIKFLRGLDADLFVVIAYGQILSQEILDIPRLMPINLHASLLPRYRGAAPINWAIINGESQTGVSIIRIIKKMDAGPIIMQRPCSIGKDDTAVSLGDRLSRLGAELLPDAVGTIAKNNYQPIPQEENLVTFAPKLKKQDGCINWDKPALEIYNLIRGCFDWPGAFTYYKGKLLKVYKVKPDFQARQFMNFSPGEIIEATRDGIEVAAGSGNLLIEELQIEGKRVMGAEAFLSGHKVCPGELLGKK